MLYDVVIAGAGPVGLFLAAELAQGGAQVLVLEQSAEADTPLKRLPFGLRGLNAPTLEALDRRGLLQAVAASQIRRPDKGAPPPGTAHWLAQPRPLGGHFAGITFPLDRVDSGRWPYRLPGSAPTQMPVELAALEAVLAEHALALGVHILRGVTVENIQPQADQVCVEAGGQRFSGRWLVGCDGGRSTVRKRGGFAFVGTEPEFTGHSLSVTLEDPAVLTPGRQYSDHGMCNFNPPGTLALADFDGGAGHRQALTRETAEALLRRVSGRDARVRELHLATTWTDAARQADRYRNGRVLLAGDAAHVHSPLGGQGLNLGVGDAMNLGWKLAAVLRGDAGEELLDSYHAERHPIGATILDWSRAQVALMRPGAGSRALAAVMADLLDSTDGATYMAERVWGVSQQLQLDGSHPLVGRSAPDVVAADGTRMAEVLRAGRGVFWVFDAASPLRGALDAWQPQITCVAERPEDGMGLAALLVRPDGIVAWAADIGDAGAGVTEAAARWFRSAA